MFILKEIEEYTKEDLEAIENNRKVTFQLKDVNTLIAKGINPSNEEWAEKMLKGMGLTYGFKNPRIIQINYFGADWRLVCVQK